jgi:hypothetical protein
MKQLEENRGDLYTFFINNNTQQEKTHLQNELNFSQKAIATMNILVETPHNLDEIKASISETMEALFLALSKTGVDRIFSPSPLIKQYRTAPSELRTQFIMTTQRLLGLMAQNMSLTLVEQYAQILEGVEVFVDVCLDLGGYKNFDSLVHQYVEYKLLWPAIKKERDSIIKNKPYLKYQIESESIFPLRYILGESAENFKKLLWKGKVYKIPEYPVFNWEIKNLLASAVKNMRTEQDKTIADVRDIIGEFLNFSPQDVNILNDNHLLITVAQNIERPTFYQAWERTHTSNFALRKMLREAQDPPPVLPNINIPQPQPAQAQTPLNSCSTVLINTVQHCSTKPHKVRRKLTFENLPEEKENQVDMGSPLGTINLSPSTGILTYTKVLHNKNSTVCSGTSSGNRPVPDILTPGTEANLLEEFLGLSKPAYSPITPW